MKKLLFFISVILCVAVKSKGQSVTAGSLVGIWDQNVSNHAATIIFDDTSRVRFSYKGRKGSTKKYYYILNNAQTPAILTVDYKANHKKHRNEYLIEFIDKNTMRLQVLHKKDDRTHFNESEKENLITLNRRLDL